jgi:hypothetical protein
MGAGAGKRLVGQMEDTMSKSGYGAPTLCTGQNGTFGINIAEKLQKSWVLYVSLDTSPLVFSSGTA